MNHPQNPFGLQRSTWKLLAALILATGVFVILYAAAIMAGMVQPVGPKGGPADITDFDIFHLVGRMIWQGNLPLAYDIQALHDAQIQLYNAPDVMTWSYPPQFDLLVAVLGLMPRSLAYLLFIGASFAGFVHVMRRLAGGYDGAVLLAIAPALLIVARNGQNGLLTGTLIGLFCLAFVQRRAVAGLPLGLMVIKPHLAVGISVLALLTRSWKTMALAAAVVVISTLIATLAFGPSVWQTFLDGAAQATSFMWAGYFPAFYMTSVFATLTSLGFSADTAMAGQIASAAFACLSILAAVLAGIPRRELTGVAVLGSVIISPYNYGYDLPMLGIAFALLFPVLDRSGRGLEKLAVFALSWTACGWGAVRNSIRLWESDTPIVYGPDPVPSLASIAVLLLVLIVFNIVRRDFAATRALANRVSRAPAGDPALTPVAIPR